jgi:hypothetical protein
VSRPFPRPKQASYSIQEAARAWQLPVEYVAQAAKTWERGELSSLVLPDDHGRRRIAGTVVELGCRPKSGGRYLRAPDGELVPAEGLARDLSQWEDDVATLEASGMSPDEAREEARGL